MAHGLEATLAVLQKQGFYNMEVGETKHSPASDPLHHEICTPVLSPLHVAFLPAKAEQQQMKTAQFLGQRDRHISLTEVQFMPFAVLLSTAGDCLLPHSVTRLL